ncbi:MAG: hypothetical protein J3K34DRAFT_487042 [Monoraphidium minutum]|nr:MAG: hypothetical protein J3K34DRAFT_487042 [Monoraphidium minutum]
MGGAAAGAAPAPGGAPAVPGGAAPPAAPPHAAAAAAAPPRPDPPPPPFAPAAAADGDALSMEINPFTLAFRSPATEAHFLREVAKARWPVLMFVFLFDCLCFSFRFAAKLAGRSGGDGAQACANPMEVVREMGHQLANMGMLYVLIGLLNRRARRSRSGGAAARQEEVLLSAVMALAIGNLLASLRADNSHDYVYMSYFLIATTTFLKIRWWVGTGLLAAPTVAAHVWHGSPAVAAAARALAGGAEWELPWLAPPGAAAGAGAGILPADAVVHITVAWAVGGLMSYLMDWYQRQMYAHARLAAAAHAKELTEARGRAAAERELAAAQQQAAQRALSVAREKAANEAKSEFMSLMCHEVRTPLNGCLASAEMLLETCLAEEQRELAKTIRVSGSILLSTVSNFLDFFKLEAGKRLDTVRSEVLLSELVGDVHCIIEAMCGRGGDVALLPPDLTAAPAAPVLCDADRLRGVLLNLATNAAKFTRAGHICLRVREVGPDGFPSPPPGFAGITIRPVAPYAQLQPGGDGGGGGGGAAAGDVAAFFAEGEEASGGGGPDPLASGAARWLRERRRQGRMVRECSFDGPPPAGKDAAAAAPAAAAAGGGAGAPPGGVAPQGGVSGGAAAGAAIVADGRAARPANGAACWAPPWPLAAGGAGAGGGAAAARWLLFEVEDTGCGVGPEGLHGLFKEYVQGTDDEMRKPRAKGGTGLGLSICSKQVAVLGGAIGAFSRPGRGSTFWFMIPADLAAAGGGDDAADAAAAAAPRPRRKSALSLVKGWQQQAAAAEWGAAAAAAHAGGAPHAGGQQQQQQQQQHLKQGQPAPAACGPGGACAAGGAGAACGAAPCGSGRPPRPSGSSGALSSLDHAASSASGGGSHLLFGSGSFGSSGSCGVGGGGACAAAHLAAGGGGGGAPLANGGALAGCSLLYHRSGDAAAPGAPPPQTPPLPPPPAPPGLAGGGGRQKAPLDASRLAGLSVLLAEDNAINQLVAKKMLSGLGMRVVVAGNGAEAVKAVEDAAAANSNSDGADANAGSNSNGGFSVVLMDLLMPVMGGLEATAAIRAAGHDVPIVAMTANAGDRDRAECAAAGMDGFLPKPVLRDQLAGAILAVLPPAGGGGGGPPPPQQQQQQQQQPQQQQGGGGAP